MIPEQPAREGADVQMDPSRSDASDSLRSELQAGRQREQMLSKELQNQKEEAEADRLDYLHGGQHQSEDMCTEFCQGEGESAAPVAVQAFDRLQQFYAYSPWEDSSLLRTSAASSAAASAEVPSDTSGVVITIPEPTTEVRKPPSGLPFFAPFVVHAEGHHDAEGAKISLFLTPSNNEEDDMEAETAHVIAYASKLKGQGEPASISST